MKEKKGWLRHFVFVGVQLIRTYGTEGTVAFSKEKKTSLRGKLCVQPSSPCFQPFWYFDEKHIIF